MDWTVEEALNEVAVAIEAGAAPLAVDPQTQRSLKSLFKEDFNNRQAAGARWCQDKERVLPLAQRIGERAKLLMLDRLALSREGDRATDRIDEEIALRAAYYVCKTYQAAGRRAGPYCSGIPIPPGVDENAAVHKVLGLIRRSGNEV
jgi:hypothetical protein